MINLFQNFGFQQDLSDILFLDIFDYYALNCYMYFICIVKGASDCPERPFAQENIFL